MSTRHDLKTQPAPFQAVWDDLKRYEVRADDRGYRVGHVLELREWDPLTDEYSGRVVTAQVTYKTLGGTYGLPPELCVLGIHVLMKRLP